MFENVVFWYGVGAGFVGAILVLAMVVPDRWAMWIATRRNLPIWLMPFGVVALVLGLGNLLYALGTAVSAALASTVVMPWVWWVTLIGLAVVVLFLATKKIAFRIPNWRKK